MVGSGGGMLGGGFGDEEREVRWRERRRVWMLTGWA